MTKITRTFTQQELDDLDVPYEHMVEQAVVDTDRWSTIHEGVFRHPDGRHYHVSWQEPATEQQECDTWVTDPVVATEVELREVTVKQWLPLEGEARP